MDAGYGEAFCPAQAHIRANRDQAAACAPLFFVRRLRATSALAAAPNSSTIGGAGTSAGGPPVDPLVPLDVLVEDELVMPLDVLQPLLLEP
ncbi:MAG: hypothetical protein WC816_02315 [Sphingomonas sp.]|jgi:hypothetical protein